MRPWQHVLEPLAGYLLLAQRLYGQGEAFAGPWNFGPDSGNTVRVSEVVKFMLRRWGRDARAEMLRGADMAEAVLLQLDSSKARGSMGWRQRLNLESTIDWTVEWYQRRAAGEAASALCTEQIKNYEEKI